MLTFSFYYQYTQSKDNLNKSRSLKSLTQEAAQIEKIIREFDDLEAEQKEKITTSIYENRAIQPYVRSFMQLFLKPVYRLNNVGFKLGANEVENTIQIRKDSATGIEYALMEVTFQYRYWEILKDFLADIKRDFAQSAIVGFEMKGNNVTMKVLHIQSNAQQDKDDVNDSDK